MGKKKTEITDESRAELNAQLTEAKRAAFFAAFHIIRPAAILHGNPGYYDDTRRAVIEAFRVVDLAGAAYQKTVRHLNDYYPSWGTSDIVAQACAIAHADFDPGPDVCPDGAMGAPLLVFAAVARFLGAVEQVSSLINNDYGVEYYDPKGVVNKCLGKRKQHG